MRVLHLLRRPASEAMKALVEREANAGDVVIVVLVGAGASFPETQGVQTLPGPGCPRGIDAGALHDLLFDCDRVVGW